MAVDLNATLASGGRPTIDLLEFCVCSIQMDPVFCYLAKDFKHLPTAKKATALYEGFCSPHTPARISCHRLLPPFDRRILNDIDPLRPAPPAPPKPEPEIAEDVSGSGENETGPSGDNDEEQIPDIEPAPPRLPPRYIFDKIVAELERSSASIRQIALTYNPALSPQQNLPGGRMTPAQRQFVETIWQPQLRPFLVDAGFFRIANIA